MKSNIEACKSFFAKGYEICYELEKEIPSFRLGTLLYQLTQSVLPEQTLQSLQLKDLKGRDPLNLIDSNISPALRPTADEVFFIAGRILELHPATCSTADGRFTVRLSSRFLEFEGQHHILHGLTEQRTGEIPEFLSIPDLGLAFPLVIDQLRFGLDLFKSTSLSALLGFSPTVCETILLEAEQNQFRLRIRAEGLKVPSQLPLQTDNLFNRLADALLESFEFDLSNDYLRHSKQLNK